MEMHKITVAFILLIFMFMACTNKYDITDAKSKEIREAAQDLFLSNGNKTGEIQIYPNAIIQLQPESVTMRADGLYIQLDGFFVQESGLFIPRDDANVVEGTSSDPGYVKLGSGIYRYWIKG